MCDLPIKCALLKSTGWPVVSAEYADGYIGEYKCAQCQQWEKYLHIWISHRAYKDECCIIYQSFVRDGLNKAVDNFGNGFSRYLGSNGCESLVYLHRKQLPDILLCDHFVSVHAGCPFVAHVLNSWDAIILTTVIDDVVVCANQLFFV